MVERALPATPDAEANSPRDISFDGSAGNLFSLADDEESEGEEEAGFVAQCPHCMTMGFHSRCDFLAPEHTCEFCKSGTRLCARGGTECVWAATIPDAGAGQEEEGPLCVMCSGGKTFTAEQQGAFVAEQVCSRAIPMHPLPPHPSHIPSPLTHPQAQARKASSVKLAAYFLLRPSHPRPCTSRAPSAPAWSPPAHTVAPRQSAWQRRTSTSRKARPAPSSEGRPSASRTASLGPVSKIDPQACAPPIHSRLETGLV